MLNGFFLLNSLRESDKLIIGVITPITKYGLFKAIVYKLPTRF